MYLLAPVNFDRLNECARWFKKPIARKLAVKKGVGFGVELKGEPETIKKAPPFYWGYHLPDNFASQYYYHPETRRNLMSSLSHIPSFKPQYVNIHGMHLWWEPKNSRGIKKYINHSEPEEYLKILKTNIELINKLKKTLPLTIENYPLYAYCMKDGKRIPDTFLLIGIGRLDDLLYLKKKTGVGILLDVEHLITTLNFLNRIQNYRDIPIEKISNLTQAEQKVKDIFGFFLRKGSFPYVEKKIDMAKMIEKVGAKRYHVTGSTQDVIFGKKIVTHGPIELEDETFRKNLRLILAQKPESILLETANSRVDSDFPYLRPNETQLSFYNLCEILLEEL